MSANRHAVRDFARKLRATSVVLGCGTHKELDAVFRAANPDTAFDLGRSYKWMQGRAVPRGVRLYEEWARLLDTGHDASWLAACALEDFLVAIARRHAIPVERLREATGTQPAAAGPAVADSFILGSYAVYVAAQSPHYAGRILRGALHFLPAQTGGGMTATLVQHFAGLRAAFTGPALPTAQGLALQLRSEDERFAPAFCSFFRPTPPGSLLAGIISTFVAVHPGTQPPYAALLLALRVSLAAEAVEGSNRYLGDDEPLGADLTALGLPVEAAPDLPGMMRDWLAQPAGRLPPEAYAGLVARCDGLHLASVD